MPASRLVLPVMAGQRYTIRLELQVPTHALGAEAGLYADGKLIAPLSSDPVLTANMPAVDGDRVRLELRCAGWIPQKAIPCSQDPRTLGVQVFTVTMRAEGAPARVFNANTGAISGNAISAPDKP